MATDKGKNEKCEKEFPHGKVKIEFYGEEMIVKKVKSCGKNGRVYLPLEWIGKKVKVVKC